VEVVEVVLTARQILLVVGVQVDIYTTLHILRKQILVIRLLWEQVVQVRLVQEAQEQMGQIVFLQL
jgi:hypothetical protein